MVTILTIKYVLVVIYHVLSVVQLKYVNNVQIIMH